MALSFERTIKRLCPPWLQRTVGVALMGAIGAELDGLLDRVDEGVRLRFPDALADHAEALARIGRERRIRRGPGENATTYASRLLPWWDEHRVRGGPYALLRQLHAFFLARLNVRMDVVYHSGTRRWADEAGTITRDAVTWDADGSDDWSQFWLFFYVGESDTLVTLDGDTLVTLGGDGLVTLGGAAGLGSDEEEILSAIPREWSAAHILRITIVLLYGTARLWNYPQPVPTWAEWGVESNWGGNSPTIYVLEE